METAGNMDQGGDVQGSPSVGTSTAAEHQPALCRFLKATGHGAALASPPAVQAAIWTLFVIGGFGVYSMYIGILGLHWTGMSVHGQHAVVAYAAVKFAIEVVIHTSLWHGAMTTRADDLGAAPWGLLTGKLLVTDATVGKLKEHDGAVKKAAIRIPLLLAVGGVMLWRANIADFPWFFWLIQYPSSVLWGWQKDVIGLTSQTCALVVADQIDQCISEVSAAGTRDLEVGP